MELIKGIMSRRSVRKFASKAVEFDKIALILQAGATAPSVGNLQDYRFIIVTNKEQIKNLADHCVEQYWIAQASVVLVVCVDTEITESYYGLRGQRLYSVQDAAAATQNMLLTAHGLGLGACWVGSFDENYVSDVLQIPEKVRPQALIPIGYQDEEPDERHVKDLNTMVFFNSYGNKIENVNALLHEYNKEIDRYVKKADVVAESAFEKLKHHAKKLVDKAKNSKKKNS